MATFWTTFGALFGPKSAPKGEPKMGSVLEPRPSGTQGSHARVFRNYTRGVEKLLELELYSPKEREGLLRRTQAVPGKSTPDRSTAKKGPVKLPLGAALGEPWGKGSPRAGLNIRWSRGASKWSRKAV